MAFICYSKRVPSTISKGEKYGGEAQFGGNQKDIYKRPFSVESHRMCLIHPARTFDNACEMLPIRESQRPSDQSFYWGLFT